MSSSAEVILKGHIIDSLILSKVLDEIVSFGGQFQFQDFQIGTDKESPSFALLQVTCDTDDALAELLSLIGHHGATIKQEQDAEFVAAEQDGVFPESFYSTTNQRTLVRLDGTWQAVDPQEMDCGIRLAAGQLECVPVAHVKQGDSIVCGFQGVRVEPQERRREASMFEFMSSAVSSEKPKHVLIREVASQMRRVKEQGKKILLVGGPAIVHTGARDHVVRLIEMGFFHVLFAGNALATHDIEQSLHGTSLGVHVDRAVPVDSGHEHHIRSINTIRQQGSIRKAVDAGVLTSGIMHACVKHNVGFVLGGSVRDDGPLPDTITDVLEAQDAMRRGIADVGFVLIVATALHGIATGNILPAWVPMVCVDIEAAVVTKLADRGSWQTVGIVTDVEPFFNELLQYLQ